MSDLFIDIAKVRSLVDSIKECADNDINGLIRLNRELSIYSYYLAEHLTDLHKIWVDSEAERKYQLGKFITHSSNVSKAKETFNYQTEYYKREKQAESAYKSVKELLNQANNITKVLSVEISNLKQERQSVKSDS